MVTPLFLSLLAIAITLGLLSIAAVGQRSSRAQKLAGTPVIAILSLGIISAGITSQLSYMFATSMPHGVFYLFFGFSIVFLSAPLLVKPIYHCVRKYNFEHIVDMLAFRFRNTSVGPLVTFVIAAAVLPLLATQLQALAETIVVAADLKHPQIQWHTTGLLMLPMILFIFVLHSPHIQKRKRNNGVILIAAIDTLIRFIALYALGWFGYQLTGDITPALFEPEAPHVTTQLLSASPLDSLPPTIHDASNLVLLAFALTLCLPQIFKFAFTEKPARPSIDAMTWGVPLLLLLMSLPFYAIISSLQLSDIPHNAYDFMTQLALQSGAPWLTYLLLLSGLSGFLCTTLILVGSCTSQAVNYWVLPFYTQTHTGQDLFRWLRRTRRTIALIFIALVWITANILHADNALYFSTEIAPGILVQLFPGITACVLFPRVSSYAFMGGLIAGIGCIIVLGLPDQTLNSMLCIMCSAQDLSDSNRLVSALSNHTISLSLITNCVVMVLISVAKPASKKDYVAAGLMMNRNYQQPEETQQSPYTVQDFITALVPLVGVQEAEKHVHQAMTELQISAKEQRPYILIQLHNVVERSLSRSLGDSVAQNAISQLMPYSLSRIQRVSVVDQRLNEFQSGFSGIAGELDKLRRFHRNTLAKLPVGVCYINVKREILLWNESLARISGLRAGKTEGKYLRQLPAPWSQLLTQFIRSDEASRTLSVDVTAETRWIRLHKDVSHTKSEHEYIVVIEDITDIKNLEDELIHRERLASIGSLAAGVAHEIGNPVTGIACLAQNIELDTDEPELLETAKEIINQTERISAIMQNLVGFSHAGGAHMDIKREDFYLSDCVNDAIKLLSLDNTATQVEFSFESADRDHTAMIGDPQRMQQVFVNLLSNARDASEAGSLISTTLICKGSTMELAVTDQGSGIPKTVQDKIFEPFFTTKQVGQGTGLGLALVFGIIEEHAGLIRVTSPITNGRGTRFTIALPRQTTVSH